MTSPLPFRAIFVALAAALLGLTSVRAQVAVASLTQTGVEPATLPGNEATPEMASQPEPALPEATPATVDANQNAVSGIPRRFHYSLQLQLRGVYDDNISVSQQGKVGDYYFVLEPQIMLGIGDVVERAENFLRGEYTLGVFRYVDHTEADTVQHSFRLEGQYRASRLTLSLGQDISILNGGTFDPASVTERVNLTAAGRTRVDLYSTHLSASYYLTGKTFLSSAVGISINDYATGLTSSQVYFGQLFLNYDYSGKLTIGGGGGFGYNEVDPPNPNQVFEQANVRLSYNATGKLSFSGTAGAEFRQFDGDSRGTYISPVFDLSATYKPFDGTDVSLVASRRTVNSALVEAQDLVSTSFTLNVRQRFLRRFDLGLVLGYENADYFSTNNNVTAVASGRSDNYYFAQPSVDAAVTRFWTVGVYYLHRRSDSSFGLLSFDDNQFGFRTSLKF